MSSNAAAPPRLCISALAIFLFAAGCAVGPDYQRPQLSVPATWEARKPHAATDNQLIGWWERFNDPALTRFQRLAEDNSPTLEQAVARIEQARATIAGNWSQALPNITGSGSFTRTKQQTAASGHTISETRTYGLDSSWELDLFGKVRRNIQASRARVQARIDDWHDARVSLAAEVADDYVQYRGCEQLAALYEGKAQSQSESARLTRINATAGFTASADAELAEASAASMRSTWNDQVSQCDLLAKSLTSLTGSDEKMLRDMLSPGKGTVPKPAELNVTSVPADILRQRPDIASSERELAAASEEIGAAVAKLYPSLTLNGSITASGGASLWSFGPSLSVPIFDGGSALAGVRSANASYNLQLATYRESVRSAVLEVEQALVRLGSALARDADTARAADGYQASFLATERQYQAGSASIIDRESARRNALDAQNSLVTLRMTQVRDWIALYKALGGGWDALDVSSANLPTGVRQP